MDECSATPTWKPAGSFWKREVSFGSSLIAALALFALIGLLGAQTDWWWSDEAYTWDMLQRGVPEIMHRARVDVHPPLYYLALAAWHRFLPQPRAMRGFSLAAGFITVIAAGIAGFNMGGRRLGALAALFWATFPLFLHHSQEARMYAMALALQTMALAGWSMAPRHPRLGWAICVISLSAALYTHNMCLLFAAALLGGEGLRCLAARQRKRAAQTGLRWIASAAIVIGLLYLPRLSILHAQVQNQATMNYFNAPTWFEVGQKFLNYSYTLDLTKTAPGWWVPGSLMLVVFPALFLLNTMTRRSPRMDEARPIAMTLWIGMAPLFFLVIYSMTINPMFETSRHGVLFIPFLLFPAAAWWEESCRRVPTRLLSLCLIAVSGFLALGALSRSRDLDLRPHRDALMERAPVGVPIVFYPPVFNYTRLLWSPLPVLVHGSDDRTIQQLTSCTLVIYNMFSPREVVSRNARTVMRQAKEARPVYVSYDVAAYHLVGLLPGKIEELIKQDPEQCLKNPEWQAGSWAPRKPVGIPQLVKSLSPKGELFSFSPQFPDWQGLRLSASRNELSLRVPEMENGALAAIMAAGRFISAGSTSETLKCAVNGGGMQSIDLAASDFLACRISGLTGPEVTLNFEVPEALIPRRHAPFGDVPPGIYLTWAGVHLLHPEDFHEPTVKGTYLDVGAVGDVLFLRSGFNEVEGAPPAEIRWTRGNFVVEAPVWSAQPVREVVLLGLLPAQVNQRHLTLKATHCGSGRVANAWTDLTGTEYGEAVFEMPEPLEPGVWRLEFQCGTWSPKEVGMGEDPRRLGFYLNAIVLR